MSDVKLWDEVPDVLNDNVIDEDEDCGSETNTIAQEINKVLHNIEEDLDNLNVYTIYMGPGQSDRVCVDFSEVMDIMQKYHRK